MHHEFTPKQIARFWSYVDRSGGPDACWPWTRSRHSKGYGQYGVGGHNYRTNRLAYFLEYGEWPEPIGCHTCDNPPCCNPAHIYAGTPKQNTADMVRQGKHNRPHARFSDDEVRAFRARYAAGETLKAIAASAGHDMSAMSKLLRGLHYRHIT